MTLSNQIVRFLKAHPLISVRALEIECGIPISTLSGALSEGRAIKRDIPKKHIPKLVEALKKYGFKSE